MSDKEYDEQGRELLEYEGKSVRRLRNGILQDVKTGHFLTPPTRGMITTSEEGRELVRQRWEAARFGLLDAWEDMALNEGKVPDERGLAKALSEKIIKSMLASKSLRDLERGLAAISRMAQWSEPPKRVETKSESVNVTGDLSALEIKTFQAMYPGEPDKALKEYTLWKQNPQKYVEGMGDD